MDKTSLVDAGPAALPPFAILLREYRDAAGLTQEELAERSGVSVRAISDLERGAKTRPHLATIRLLAAGLGLGEEEQSALQAAVPSRHHSADYAARSLDLPVGGFLGAVPEGPLVSREHEVERIRQLVEMVKSGVGRLVLLAGEPGVGKTRLAQEAAVICRAQGMHLATGRCYEPQQGVAFYPFLEILSRLVATGRSRLGIEPLERWPYLAPLVPEAHPTATRPPLTVDGDQQRLFWAVGGLIEALAGTMPVAVALDDLHWADQSSLDLLQHLARQLRNHRVLLLGTYRDVEAGRSHPLNRALRDLHREHLVEEIGVGRMSERGTAALMASISSKEEISPGLVSLVHRHTEGNAFFTQEVVRALSERGDICPREGSGDRETIGEIAIPSTVREAIAERLSRLSEDAQAILAEASVLGHVFTFDDLQAMSRRAEDELEEGLDQAGKAGIVRVAESDSYTFNHVLTQQVLYTELTPRHRKRLHRAAGEAIERRPGRQREKRAAELAWHFLEGGDGGRASTYFLLAGDRAEAVFAHSEAERHDRTARDLAHAIDDAPREAAALEKLGRVLTNVGRYAEAREALEQAARLYREGADQAGEVRVTVQVGFVHRAAGTPAAGIAAVQAVLQGLDTRGQSEGVAELCIVLETLYYSTAKYPEALTVAERAAHLARAAGDQGMLGRAEVGRGTELLMLGRVDEGLRVLESAMELAEAAHDPYNLTRALNNAALGYRWQGQLEQSRQTSLRCLALQERIENPWGTVLALSGLGSACRLLGEVAQARAHLERAESLCHALGPASWAAEAHLELAALCLNEGNWEQAATLAGEGLELARPTGNLEGIRCGELVLAELDLFEGRPDRAVERLAPLLDRPGLTEVQVTLLLPALAQAEMERGHRERAAAILTEAMDRATTQTARLAAVDALRVRGMLLSRQCRWPEARDAFEQALALEQDIGYPYAQMRILYELGLLHLQEGETQRARERLGEALTIARRLNARPYCRRIERALAEAERR